MNYKIIKIRKDKQTEKLGNILIWYFKIRLDK